MKIYWQLFLLLVFGLAISARSADPQVSGRCLTCHKEKSPGLYRQWLNSRHGLHKVVCLDCHSAGADDKDGFMHEGALIATLVTPTDCGRCHEKEANEMANSHHATAGLILESQDAYLANVTAGEPAAILGCESCHGAKVKIDVGSPNRLSRKSWPNSGIGRINPDGSRGSCNACHTRHTFTKAQARQPEACSKCHLGPDHPQKEVYEESKHGNTYYTNIDKMSLDADEWVVGVDYFTAPTCATCHMSAAPGLPFNHDVGQRISWTLRPAISVYKEDWRQKRSNMKKVCINCHGTVFADGHYYQFDAAVRLYNEKFAGPAGEIMRIITENRLLENPANFSNEIEWIYWELWHHEGRRARHGASMMGPDYTWWHGFYDFVQHFYFKFLPEARRLNNTEVNEYIDNLIENDPMHSWLLMNTDKLKEDLHSGAIQKIYEEMFKSD